MWTATRSSDACARWVGAFFARPVRERARRRAADGTSTARGPASAASAAAGSPGDPIRFTEVVDAIVADPDVWGVEKLAMKVEERSAFVPQSAGSLAIPPNAIPVLADARCLRVRFSTTGRCGDA